MWPIPINSLNDVGHAPPDFKFVRIRIGRASVLGGLGNFFDLSGLGFREKSDRHVTTHKETGSASMEISAGVDTIR